MPLLPSAKKAEQFAALLDGSSSGTPGELASLGQLVQRLSAVPQPRPEFASALRAQLMQQATATLPSAAGTPAAGTSAAGTPISPAAGPGPTAAGSVASATTGAAGGAVTSASAASGATLPAVIPFATGVLATAVAISGVGLGASQSLPGQPLYGVKRQVESIQYDLAGGATDKAEARLGFATARLDEIAALLDGRAPDQPLSAELQQRIRTLLSEWAGETNRGTTVLLDQLAARRGDLPAIRDELVDFTTTSARELAAVVQQIPDPALQSLTGSAFAYLQRIDTALGDPVQIAALLPTLGLALPSAAAPSAVAVPGSTTPTSPGTPSTGTGSGTAGNAASPSSVPTLPIPTGGARAPRGDSPGSTPVLPSVPTRPVPGDSSGSGGSPGGVGGAGGGVTGGAGGAAGGATGTVGSTVDGVLKGVTGKGPTLPLPTSVPTLGR